MIEYKAVTQFHACACFAAYMEKHQFARIGTFFLEPNQSLGPRLFLLMKLACSYCLNMQKVPSSGTNLQDELYLTTM